MITVSIPPYMPLTEWRPIAKQYLETGVPPTELIWQPQEQQQETLFAEQELLFLPTPATNKPITVPKQFMELAETALCYRQPTKYAVLYRLLWRLQTERNLLHITTDDDVRQLRHMTKAVYRDAYKMTAFLRFRQVKQLEDEYFIAWYQPLHYSLERSLPFFMTRFKNMYWSILTPYLAAHWNQQQLVLEANPSKENYPTDDTVEDYWLTYYASTYNPARAKPKAMMTQMPKQYWHNMPETKLIKGMLQGSQGRVEKMIAESRSQS